MTEQTERKATVVRPGEGDTREVVGDRYRLLARGGDTDRSYVVLEGIVAPGGGPPIHYHTREEEGFYVLEGEFEFMADGEVIRATAGTFLNLPKESRHGYRNVGSTPGRLLVVCAPAGFEEFLRAADRQGPDRVVEIAERFGVHILPQGH